MTAATQVSVFGIRHHGPGSARSLVRALGELTPDLVLIEGPPEADGLVALVGNEALRPPVALLAYATGDVRQAAFWPMAVFSPEWCALRYAASAGIPARFCDLPYAYRIGRRSPVDTPAQPSDVDPAAEPSDVDAPTEPSDVDKPGHGGAPGRPADPLALLAEAAGYDDAERWWDDVIEHRRDSAGPFAAIAEAMAAVRADQPPDPDDRDLVREAYMRTVLRSAMKEGHARVAVVCGAWHVPALTAPLPSAASDAALLKGMAKTAARRSEVAATWVPWTHGRLASWTGYGAGVTSPGWYHHLFTSTDQVVQRWLVAVAAVLRDEDLPVSSAHLIEAVRLAEALATMRGRPLPGLAEVTEATRAVLCDGDEVRLAMIQRRVVVGELLGQVPPEAPAVPLARDLAATQKRLRLPPEALARTLDLDLRRPIDLARSHLLHRLRLLEVEWGTPEEAGRTGKGTFWESWRLAWAPEFTVDVIAASAYGTTVAAAAGARAAETAAGAPDLATVTTLVERCLLADLGDALPAVLRALDERLARDTDVAQLMDALAPLTRSLRYGDVRGTDTGALASVVAGLVLRACVGLGPALTGLDDTAAAAMRDRVDTVHGALRTLSDADLTTRWLDALTPLADRDDLPGLLAGRLTRLLHDEHRLDLAEVSLRMARTLTVGVPPARAAAWVEGFLAGGGLLLVHDENLLRLVDGWITTIPSDTFVEVLPLLRRTFAGYAAPERRAIGEQVRRTGTGADGPRPGSDDDDTLDPDRVALVMPVLRLLLTTDTLSRRGGIATDVEA